MERAKSLWMHHLQAAISLGWARTCVAFCFCSFAVFVTCACPRLLGEQHNFLKKAKSFVDGCVEYTHNNASFLKTCKSSLEDIPEGCTQQKVTQDCAVRGF